MLLSFYLKLFLFWIFSCCYGLIPETPRHAFLCAGRLTEVCRTGLCYDSLELSNNSQISGCADSLICSTNGCSYDGKYFTCCCSRSLCNGKSLAFLQSKWRHYISQNVIVRPYPIRYLRNVGETRKEEVLTSPASTTTSNSENLAETTVQIDKKTLEQTVEVIKSEVNSLAINLEPISTILKEAEENETIIEYTTSTKTPTQQTTIHEEDDDYREDEHDDDDDTPIVITKRTSTTESATTPVATVPTTTTTPTTTIPSTTTTASITSTTIEETTSTSSRKEIKPPSWARSTQRNNFAQSTENVVPTTSIFQQTETTQEITTTLPKSTPKTTIQRTKITTTTRRPIVFAETTAPPASEKRTKLHMNEAKPVSATSAPVKMPPPAPEVYRSTFPWYILAAVGFITSVIVAILVYGFFRKCVCVRPVKTELDENSDESNDVREVNEAEAREMTVVDPLLNGQNGQNGQNGKNGRSPKSPTRNPNNGV